LARKLNYRKFMWFNTQFAFAGVKDSNHAPEAVTPDYDDRKWPSRPRPKMIAGELKAVPDLPVITVAEDMEILSVTAKSAGAPQPKVTLRKKIGPLNDYGIGCSCKAT